MVLFSLHSTTAGLFVCTRRKTRLPTTLGVSPVKYTSSGSGGGGVVVEVGVEVGVVGLGPGVCGHSVWAIHEHTEPYGRVIHSIYV